MSNNERESLMFWKMILFAFLDEKSMLGKYVAQASSQLA